MLIRILFEIVEYKFLPQILGEVRRGLYKFNVLNPPLTPPDLRGEN